MAKRVLTNLELMEWIRKLEKRIEAPSSRDGTVKGKQKMEDESE